MTTKKAKNARQRETTPKAIQDTHELLAWMLPHLDKMPRNRRFTLGSRIIKVDHGIVDRGKNHRTILVFSMIQDSITL